MKNWLKKLSVILITIMTLGFYTPPITLSADPEENKDSISSKEAIADDDIIAHSELPASNIEQYPYNDSDYLVSMIAEQAAEQVVEKFGPRIAEKIEDEFMRTILPNMEDVLKSLLANAGDEMIPYFGITEQPSQGHGERIFHIYNHQTNEDLARFHVRRDNRPLEGYWFNFHYHLSEDNFEQHHDIGEIYWDKNTPPRWMS